MSGTRKSFWRRGAITATAMVGFLFCVTTTLAATIEKDGDVATAIRGLQIGSITYDVAFLNAEAPSIYPPGSFDFNNAATAAVAVEAIVAVLNADGSLLNVGEGGSDPLIISEMFLVPYEKFEITINPPFFGPKPRTIRFLRIWEGYTNPEELPGDWVSGDILDAMPLLSSGMFAKFTLVDSGGIGNSPPVADAGGPYVGEVGVAVVFDGTGSSDADGNIVDRNWFFGDGGTSDGETPSHTYMEKGVYNVSHEVIDGQGASDSDSANAVIGFDSIPPHADAGGPYSGSVGAAVSFDGSGSTDPDGNIATWAWDFGDSNNANGPTPNHTYDAGGKYTVTLTVTDNSGETDKGTSEATIGIGNLPPVADAGGPYIGAAGVPKTFDGTRSTDPDGDTLTYAWNFGDGNPGTGPTPTHTYATQGSYSVSLSVTDDADATSSAATTAVIGDGNPPVADRLVDLVTLVDVAGSAGADLAVLDVALANNDQLSATVHVHDGSTGDQLYQVDVSDSWRSIAIDTAMANAGPRLAILQRGDTGDLRVRVLDATNGTDVSTIAYFDDTWTPIDIFPVSDAGGLGIEGIGVLAENQDGRPAVEVHTIDDGNLVEQVVYFGNAWSATSAIDLGEFNGNGRSELSVLATNNAGDHAVETRDALSGAQIARVFFLGPANTTIGLADVADIDGNNRPEVVVLGNKEATNNSANTIQAKDAKTAALISKVGTYGPDWTGFGIRSIGDVDGNGSEEVVIGALNGATNGTSVSVRDVAGATLTKKIGFLGSAYDPRDVEVLADVSGNAIQEVVVAGLQPDTLSIRVQLRDALTGMVLRNIDIN